MSLWLVAPTSLNGIFAHKQSVWKEDIYEIVEGTIEDDVTFLLFMDGKPYCVGTDLDELKDYALNG
jgi:hypothetical protein